MRFSKSPHLRTLLALIPLLSRSLSFAETAQAACFIALAVFGSTHLFIILAPLFPKKLLHISFILFVAAIYQSLSYFVAIPVFYLVSFLLLFDWNDVSRNRLGPKSLRLLPRLVTFLTGAFLLGVAQDYLARRFGSAPFRQPVRMLIMLALYAWALTVIARSKATKQSAFKTRLLRCARNDEKVIKKPPVVFLVHLRFSGKIFGMLGALYVISFLLERFFPSGADLLPGLAFLTAFALGKYLKLPEPFLWMAFALWVYLQSQTLGLFFFPAALLLSLGISFIVWMVEGLRFRLALTPSAAFFSTLPGLLALFALVALYFSSFFTSFR